MDFFLLDLYNTSLKYSIKKDQDKYILKFFINLFQDFLFLFILQYRQNFKKFVECIVFNTNKLFRKDFLKISF